MNSRTCAWAMIMTATAIPSSVAFPNPSTMYEISCPPLLEMKAVAFVGAVVPNGWKPYMPSSLEVRTAQLMYGPPEAQRPAIPLSHADNKLARTANWDFTDIPEDEKWLSCGYGLGGELTLSKPLPRAISTCTVTVEKEKHGWVAGVSVHCEPLR